MSLLKLIDQDDQSEYKRRVQMNKPRLKKIYKVARELEELVVEMESKTEELQDLLYEEEDYHDNMPENLQYSYQGERSEEAVDVMTDAVSNLEKITETITKSISEIDDVVGDLESLY